MPGIAFCVVLGLAACAASEASQPVAGPSDMQGWQLSSGKAPTKAEFAAVVATCQDKAKTAGTTSIDDCLTDFGLRRAP